jgi:hypothetical protein
LPLGKDLTGQFPLSETFDRVNHIKNNSQASSPLSETFYRVYHIKKNSQVGSALIETFGRVDHQKVFTGRFRFN